MGCVRLDTRFPLLPYAGGAENAREFTAPPARYGVTAYLTSKTQLLDDNDLSELFHSSESSKI